MGTLASLRSATIFTKSSLGSWPNRFFGAGLPAPWGLHWYRGVAKTAFFLVQFSPAGPAFSYKKQNLASQVAPVMPCSGKRRWLTPKIKVYSLHPKKIAPSKQPTTLIVQTFGTPGNLLHFTSSPTGPSGGGRWKMAENILGPFVVVDITLDVSVVSRWYQPADSGSISTAFQSSCCQAPKAVFLLKTGAGSSKTAGPLALPNLLRVPFTTWCDQPRSRGVAIIYLENPPHKNDPTATREMNPKPSCDRFCLSQTKKTAG